LKLALSPFLFPVMNPHIVKYYRITGEAPRDPTGLDLGGSRLGFAKLVTKDFFWKNAR
jgi:hypothetical protein